MLVHPIQPRLFVVPFFFALMGASLSPQEEARPVPPAQDEAQSALVASGNIAATAEHIEFGFGDSDESWTLYDYILGCGEVSPMLFRFDVQTERALKASKIRLNGTKTVDWDKLAGFTDAMLRVGGFSSTNRGTHDVPLVEISQLEAVDSGAAINDARPSIVLETEAGYVVAFPPGGLQRHLTIFDLLKDFSRTAEVSITWSPETELRLDRTLPKLVGRRAIPKDGLVPFLTSLVSLADCNCELIGDDSAEILLISLK